MNLRAAMLVGLLASPLPACGWNSSCQRFFLVEDLDTCWDAGPDAPANAATCHAGFAYESGLNYQGNACVLSAGNCLTGQCTAIPRSDGDAGLLGLCTSACTTDCSDAGFVARQRAICVGGTCLASCMPGSAADACDVGTECVVTDAGAVCLPAVCTRRW